MATLIEDDEIATLTLRNGKTVKIEEDSHYVDNQKLSKIMIEWRAQCDAAKALKQDRPRIPEFVGECIYKMAINMGKRHNFRGYSFLDEMQSDSVLHTCKYIHNFNPNAKTKSGKPSAFSYINRIIWRSFTHRIQHEDRQQYLKNKSFELLGGIDAFRDSDVDDAGGSDITDASSAGISMSSIGEELMNRVYEYETKYDLGPKKKKESPTVVTDDFILAFSESYVPPSEEDLISEDDDELDIESNDGIPEDILD